MWKESMSLNFSTFTSSGNAYNLSLSSSAFTSWNLSLNFVKLNEKMWSFTHDSYLKHFLSCPSLSLNMHVDIKCCHCWCHMFQWNFLAWFFSDIHFYLSLHISHFGTLISHTAITSNDDFKFNLCCQRYDIVIKTLMITDFLKKFLKGRGDSQYNL